MQGVFLIDCTLPLANLNYIEAITSLLGHTSNKVNKSSTVAVISTDLRSLL